MNTKKIVIVLIANFLTHFSFAQVVRNDFEKYFNEYKVKGSFALYDLKKNTYTFYNESDFKVKKCPASTFKIPNSLIALETGAVKDEKEVLKWDGIKRWQESWNADTDMENAFKNSTVWFYQAVARKVGIENYRKYLKSMHYGNEELSSKVDEFWLDNSLKISPQNQIDFLVKLYHNQLPFSQRSMDIVKRIMITEKGNDYVIRAKTGWYQREEDKKNEWAWWVGYVEKADNTYFFVIRVYKDRQVPNEKFSACRKEITKKILHDLEIL